MSDSTASDSATVFSSLARESATRSAAWLLPALERPQVDGRLLIRVNLDDRCDDFFHQSAVAHELDSFLIDFFELAYPADRGVSTGTGLKAADSPHRKAAVAVPAHPAPAGTRDRLAHGLGVRRGNEYDDLMFAHVRAMLTEARVTGKLLSSGRRYETFRSRSPDSPDSPGFL
jgi:hypothetical protein